MSVSGQAGLAERFGLLHRRHVNVAEDAQLETNLRVIITNPP
ncbi:MAG: hypothetical protein ACI4QF_07895 [Kiritimatiellia bacterium]